MPELPDITVYVDALVPRIVGKELQAIRLASPFVLRSVSPRVADLVGHRITGVTRIGSGRI